MARLSDILAYREAVGRLAAAGWTVGVDTPALTRQAYDSLMWPADHPDPKPDYVSLAADGGAADAWAAAREVRRRKDGRISSLQVEVTLAVVDYLAELHRVLPDTVRGRMDADAIARVAAVKAKVDKIRAG